MFFKTDICNNFKSFAGKNLHWSLVRPTALLKRDLNTGDFLWNLRNFWEYSSLQNMSGVFYLLKIKYFMNKINYTYTITNTVITTFIQTKLVFRSSGNFRWKRMIADHIIKFLDNVPIKNPIWSKLMVDDVHTLREIKSKFYVPDETSDHPTST